MAVYFLNLKTFGRSGGASAVSAAAYRSGERIRDERTGRTYDHTDRQDVLHKEILVPSHLLDEDMSWAKDRSNLWNSAERAESRSNARVAREYLVALPVELDPAQRLALARGFSRELADRYQFAVDLAVHAPRDYPGSDPRNFHAHLLATTREVTAEGLTRKTTLELNDTSRRERGLPPFVNELFHVRERWATVTNDALREAHIEARVDHRTLAAQGIDREPYPYIPRAAFEMERHGYRSGQAERLRRDYVERVQARMQRETVLGQAQVKEMQREAVAGQPSAQATQARTFLENPRNPQEELRPKPQSLDEVRRQAREDWLKMREQMREESLTSRRANEDDLSL